MTRQRIAVLASGGGSNLQAIIDHLAARGDQRGGDVALVVAGRPDVKALQRARSQDIATEVASSDALGGVFASHRIDLVVLAGYLSLVPADVTERFRGRMLNVHPALLPSFGGKGLYGARVHRAVIEAGARVSGATVHFVDAHYDRGPIIAQWPVPVFTMDTPEMLAERVLRVEHLLLPRVVDAVARGRITLAPDGGVQRVFGVRGSTKFAFALTGDPTLIADAIESQLI